MSAPAPARPTNVRWLIVGLLMGLVFLAHFNRVSISVAGKQHFIGPDKLSEEQMGLVYSAFLIVYAVLMLPGGYLIDRIGPRRALAAMALGLGFWTVLTGALGWSGLAISAMLVPLVVVRGIAGASSAPLHPGAARAVSLWAPLRARSFANGLVTGAALVGIALTYPVFGALMDRIGWPAAFALAGSALAAVGLLWYALSADSPAVHPWSNEAERALVAGERAAPGRTRATLREVLALFRNRGLVLMTLSYGALSYVQYMFFYWIEYYFSKVLKLPDAESRRAAFIITMAMAVGMAVGGWGSDRLCQWLGFGRGCRVTALGGMGLSAGFSLLGISVGDPAAVTVCFALALGALGLCEGIFWTTAPALEPRNGGLACALLNTGGNGIGLLAPILTPLLGKAYGWDSAVVVACAICGAGGLLWLGISPPAGPAEPAGAPDEAW
jgi:MFS family permease